MVLEKGQHRNGFDKVASIRRGRTSSSHLSRSPALPSALPTLTPSQVRASHQMRESGSLQKQSKKREEETGEAEVALL